MQNDQGCFTLFAMKPKSKEYYTLIHVRFRLDYDAILALDQWLSGLVAWYRTFAYIKLFEMFFEMTYAPVQAFWKLNPPVMASISNTSPAK
jgi:hypothetical protein